MWYSLLINLLLVKVKSDQRLIAKHFIQDLLFHVQSFSDDNRLYPEFLLGVIDKSLTKFDAEEDDTIDAIRFNQYMFGLIILYVKQTDQPFKYDFIEFFLAHLLELDVYKPFEQLALDYRNGRKRLITNQYLTATEKAACCMINDFEHQARQELNNNLTINFSHLVISFQKIKSPKSIYLFCHQMSLFKGINKKFGDFIRHIWLLSFADADVDDVIIKYNYLNVNKTIQPSTRKNTLFWYTSLLDTLITKVHVHQKVMVKELIDELVRKSRLIFGNKELDLEFLAGVIIKAYEKFGRKPPNSIDGVVLSQYLFGLMIVYAKLVDERQTVKNYFFIYIFLRHMVILGGCESFIERKIAYEDGSQSFGNPCICNEEELSSDSESGNDYCYCDVYTDAEAAACYTINRFEHHILSDLNYLLTINLFDLVQICRDNWSFEVTYSLYQTVILCTNTDDFFNDFIRSIGGLLIAPAGCNHRIGFFSQPMIEVSYDNTPHLITEDLQEHTNSLS